MKFYGYKPTHNANLRYIFDVDCWDANAAQDFGISLKFVQLTSTASSNTTAKDSVGANFS